MYRAQQNRMPDPSRLTKVRKSMARIKLVGEPFASVLMFSGGVDLLLAGRKCPRPSVVCRS
jgi:hypothetical protein